jgi:hypothetical protein
MYDVRVEVAESLWKRPFPIYRDLLGALDRRAILGPDTDLDALGKKVFDLGVDVTLGKIRIIPNDIEHLHLGNISDKGRS